MRRALVLKVASWCVKGVLGRCTLSVFGGCSVPPSSVKEAKISTHEDPGSYGLVGDHMV